MRCIWSGKKLIFVIYDPIQNDCTFWCYSYPKGGIRMKRKSLWVFLSVLMIGLFLSACSNEEAFNDEWHSTAEGEGILLQATEPVTLMFSEQGMETDYSYW